MQKNIRLIFKILVMFWLTIIFVCFQIHREKYYLTKVIKKVDNVTAVLADSNLSSVNNSWFSWTEFFIFFSVLILGCLIFYSYFPPSSPPPPVDMDIVKDFREALFIIKETNDAVTPVDPSSNPIWGSSYYLVGTKSCPPDVPLTWFYSKPSLYHSFFLQKNSSSFLSTSDIPIYLDFSLNFSQIYSELVTLHVILIQQLLELEKLFVFFGFISFFLSYFLILLVLIYDRDLFD